MHREGVIAVRAERYMRRFSRRRPVEATNKAEQRWLRWSDGLTKRRSGHAKTVTETASAAARAAQLDR